MEKLGFIGAGNMASALIKGIAASNSKVEIHAFDVDGAKLKTLSQFGIIAEASSVELVKNCKYVLLAVKPQVVPAVLEEIKSAVTADKVIISIAAGISEEYIRKMTIPTAKVVLVMPNTPALLGVGAFAVARDEMLSDDEFEFVKSVLDTCGITEEVPIGKMKEVIAINGSSPAFIYLFAKGFADYAKKVGIDSDVAMRLFAQTLIGSAKMLTDSGMTPDELIKQVSSPGGTTIAGLSKLGELPMIVDDACEACTARAYELSK